MIMNSSLFHYLVPKKEGALNRGGAINAGNTVSILKSNAKTSFHFISFSHFAFHQGVRRDQNHQAK